MSSASGLVAGTVQQVDVERDEQPRRSTAEMTTRLAPSIRSMRAQISATTVGDADGQDDEIGAGLGGGLRHHVVADETREEHQDAELPHAARAVRLTEADRLQRQARRGLREDRSPSRQRRRHRDPPG